MKLVTIRTLIAIFLFMFLSLNIVLIEGLLTSRRLGLGVMLILLLIRFKKKVPPLYRMGEVFFMSFLLFMVVLFSTMSFLVNKGSTNDLGIYFIYTLVMQLVIFLLFSFYVDDASMLDAELLARLFICIGFVLAAIPIVAFFKEFNFLTITRLATVRNYIDDFLPRGQNFYLTFMSVFVSVGFSAVLGKFKLSLVWKILGFTLLIATVFLFIITGSRQFLLVVFGSCLLISIFSFPLRNLLVMISIIMAAIAIFYYSDISVFDNVAIQTSLDRIFNSSLSGSQYDGGRVYRYEIMLSYIQGSPFLGMGPNKLLYETGLYSDSSWLQLAAEMGLFPTLLVFMGLFFLVLYMFVIYFKTWSNQQLKFLYLALLSSFAVHSILLMSINDILTEYYLWLLLPILIFIRRSGKKSILQDCKL